MRQNIDALILIAVLVAVAWAGGWIWMRNYEECRAHGFSALYCWSRK